MANKKEQPHRIEIVEAEEPGAAEVETADRSNGGRSNSGSRKVEGRAG